MAIPTGFKAQQEKDEVTDALKAEYQPLMDAFLKLHFEAEAMLIGKGDENAYFKSLVSFATLVREAAPKSETKTDTPRANGIQATSS